MTTHKWIVIGIVAQLALAHIRLDWAFARMNGADARPSYLDVLMIGCWIVSAVAGYEVIAKTFS